MKKTLVALSVAALVSASASAVTVFEKDGTKVEANGSLRLLLAKAKKDEARAHSNLKNDGSRFGFTVNHELGQGVYAKGRLELRFDEKSSTDEFGKLYAKRAYVGLGHKDVGEVTFGRQVTIGDDISQAGFDYSFGVGPDVLTTSGTSVVRYDYKGVEGLQVGVNYNFAEKRKDGEVEKDQKKGGFGVGAVYSFEPSKDQSVTLAAGYTRDNFATQASQKHHKDDWKVGAAYSVAGVTVAIDGGQSVDKNGTEKKRVSFVKPGVKYQVTDASSIYGNYAYTKEAEQRIHGFMLGTDYKFHKNVVAYVEGKYEKTKEQEVTTSREKAVGAGLRVSW